MSSSFDFFPNHQACHDKSARFKESGKPTSREPPETSGNRSVSRGETR